MPKSMRKEPRFHSFRDVLSRFLTPQVWKQAHQAWHPARMQSRWKLSPLVWVLLGMAWACGDSLDERFATARMVYVASHERSRRPGQTLQGFLDAVERLPMPVLRALAQALREQLGEQFVDDLRIRGWLPMACDGTRLECPRSAQLQRRLDPAGKPESAPTVYLTALVLLPLGLLWSWRWSKGTANEQEHLRRLLPTLPSKTLLVADAFYQGYGLFQTILGAGAGFLVRLSSRSYLYTLDEAGLKRLKRIRETEAYYWPDNSARAKGLPPIKGRVLRVCGKKGDVWLFTSILDRKELSRKDAAQVCRWRWQNEGLFRQYKHLLDKTKLRSRTLAALHREGEAALLALQILLAHAAQAGQKGADGIVVVLDSPRRTLLRIRSAMTTSLHGLGPRQLQDYRDLVQRVRSEWRARTSPRTRQHWPRRKDHQPPKPPEIRTMNDELKAKLQSHLDAA
jgi:Transposase DDE domain